MNLAELTIEVDKVEAHVHNDFATRGEVEPYAWAFTPGGLVLAALYVDTPDQRRAAFERLIREDRAHGLIFVSETWKVIARTPAEREALKAYARAGGYYGNHPNRIEAVVLMAGCAEGSLTRSWVIEREPIQRLVADSEPTRARSILDGLPWGA